MIVGVEELGCWEGFRLSGDVSFFRFFREVELFLALIGDSF